MGRFNSLTPAEQALVNAAIDRGVVFLVNTQLPGGSWSNTGKHQVGYAALAGLALLECGVPPNSPVIQKAAFVVRAGSAALKDKSTYQLSLAILFLDRLGAPQDHPLIQTLALRLMAGQNVVGGWDYECPRFNEPDQQQLLNYLRQQQANRPRGPIIPSHPGGFKVGPKGGRPPVIAGPMPALAPALRQLPIVQPAAPRKDLKTSATRRDDNSNTQFAIMALWAARRHKVPTAQSFALIGNRFYASQLPTGGWGYRLQDMSDKATMNCVGLLGLAASHGSVREAVGAWMGPVQPLAQDPAMTGGLIALGNSLNQPPVKLNTYFLWALERVGVIYNLQTIGNVPWYRYGVALLLPAQRVDGSWHGGGYPGSSPPLDTAMALLFLKRANLAPDLTTNLQRYMVVVDPAALPPETKKKVDFWLSTDDPQTPPVGLSLLEGIGPERDAKPVTVTLGEVKSGTQTERQLIVRGSAPFLITAIKGTDAQCSAEIERHERKMEQVLTIRLQPNEVGEFIRTLRLVTDLPNGGTLEFNIKAQAVKER
jgi:hypothetical protein